MFNANANANANAVNGAPKEASILNKKQSKKEQKTNSNANAINGESKEASRSNKKQPKKEQKTTSNDNYWCWLMVCCCIDWELPMRLIS